MLVDVINNEIKKNSSLESSISYNKKAKAVELSEIKKEKLLLYKESSLKEKKKEKTFEFLKNALIMIAFVIVVYLGSSSNSNGERYEGKVRGVHR